MFESTQGQYKRRCVLYDFLCAFLLFVSLLSFSSKNGLNHVRVKVVLPTYQRNILFLYSSVQSQGTAFAERSHLVLLTIMFRLLSLPIQRVPQYHSFLEVCSAWEFLGNRTLCSPHQLCTGMSLQVRTPRIIPI